MRFERPREAVRIQPPICARCKHSFEPDQDDFRVRSYTERRTPRAGAAGSIDRKAAETIQSVGALAIDAPNHQREWKKLSAMGMPAQLQRKTCFLRDLQAIRNMDEQYAGHATVQGGPLQNGPEFFNVHRVPIVHAYNLK